MDVIFGTKHSSKNTIYFFICDKKPAVQQVLQLNRTPVQQFVTFLYHFNMWKDFLDTL